MASLDLPDHLIHTLSQVLNQLHEVLPKIRQEPDFSAPAFKWQDKQLKPIFDPKKFDLDDLKGIETQKKKLFRIPYSFYRVCQLTIFYLLDHAEQANQPLFEHF